MAKGKYEYWLTEDGLLLLSAWARDGLTDEDIAEKMNIHPSTLYVYKKDYPEISEALKKGKEVADIEVENALFKRATGYTHTIVKPFMYKGEVIIAELVEEIAPDVAAAFIWLKNRRPDKWRDRPEGNKYAASNESNNIIDAIEGKASFLFADDTDLIDEVESE